MRRWLFVLLLPAVLAHCGQDVHRLDLILGGVEGHAQGFLCVQDDDPSKLLFERTADYGVASVVIDFLPLDGIPGARVSELLT